MTEPIACTLTPTQAGARAEQTAAIAKRALRWRDAIRGGERLRFDAGDDVEADLRTIIAAEAECCSFLQMRLRRLDDALELDITGPAEARPIIAGLFA